MRAREVKTHKDLDVWKDGIELVKLIYNLTSSFPKEEMYGLTSQIRRSVVSIPSNIAEGAARKNKKEFVQFLYIALGSIAELETQLIISKELGYIHDLKIFDDLERLKAKLLGLIRYVKVRREK
jgi:four helix bundle protein